MAEFAQPQPVAVEATSVASAALKSCHFLFYAVLGSYSSFLGLFLEKELHYSGAQIGSVFSMRQLLMAAAPLLWGCLSDRIRMPRLLIAVGLAVSGASLVLFNNLVVFWQVMTLMAVFAFFNAPLGPLIDSVTLSYTSGSRSDYGRFRAYGSLGFVVMSLLLWAMLRGGSTLGTAFWAGAAFSMLALASLPLLPATMVPRRGFVGRRAFAVFAQRDVLILTLCGFLGYVAMMSFYSFFGNYLHHGGFQQQWIAPIWAIGTVAEMPFIFFADRIVRRIGIRQVYALGLISIALRLFVLSLQPSTAIILISQCLHALTFGAIFIGGLIYVNRRSPDDLRASAQSIYCAVLQGAGGIVGSMAAGWLVDAFNICSMMAIHSAIASFALLIFILYFLPRNS